MGIIKHNLLPKQRPRKHNLEVNIDLYPYAQDLYDELDSIGIINRIKQIPQLGVIKVPDKMSKSRYDYTILQLYLHQLIRHGIQSELLLTYNNKVESTEFPNIPNHNWSVIPTICDILQLFTIAYNVGHFFNTFTSSRTVTMLAAEDANFKELILNASTNPRYKDAALTILEEKNYKRLHLLNSLLVLEKCAQTKQSVLLATEILYAYINQDTLEQDNKLIYIFHIFKTVRNIAYMAYDLQIANTPITIDLCNQSAMELILKELLSKYNNSQSSTQLVNSISKLLDDTVYNENSNAICYYKISRRMVKLLSRESPYSKKNYYDSYFINLDSVLNSSYSHNRDYNQDHILKLTFAKSSVAIAEALLMELEHLNNTRVGYYDRSSGEQTILISIRKNCDRIQSTTAAFKTLQCVIKSLRQIKNITPSDVRFLLCTKFFLYYFFDMNPLVINPTIHKEICVLCTRGKNKRINEIKSLLKNSIGNEDEKHETQFLLNNLSDDSINDTSICIPASILVYPKSKVGESLCEFDGLIIHPLRKKEQVIFMEAKNTSYKPSYGKNCLVKALTKLKIAYKDEDVKRIGHDAVFKYTI